MEATANDLRELKRLLALGSTPYVESFFKAEIAKLQAQFPETESTAASPSSAPAQTPAQAQKPRRNYQMLDSYSFSDSNSSAKIILSKIEGAGEAEIEFEPTERGFQICIIREKQNKPNLKLTVQPLYKKINPSESKYTIRNDRITITLAKKKNTSWMKLKKSSLDKKPKSSPADNSKAKDDPNGALMDMMKKMYDEGDDEMKRTISKAMWEAQHKKPDEKDLQ
ncbi:hypothetical protein TRFO_29875 [Tritrichomonas foetus]|uniref:Calcyclin-binding protein n=1 Tax=Tritrichomonas foetus TaxID=1144522 RepID=A0A1J4JUV4_9EUKA|nr:hypothetical protein TRFO_29875 [Tritrichomonas foetus]|eukprot:OHT02929.1 hypothetical protein TRFO_29875 [Tritrichomonas foetus]